MTPIRFPLCGSQSLEDRHGDYGLKSPANTPGGLMAIPNATWHHCTNCGEELLPRSLTKAIESEQQRRLSVAVPAQ